MPTALSLFLIRYRDTESSSYLYFWTEKQGETYVHVSPMFETEDAAKDWYLTTIKHFDAAMKVIK